MNKMLRGGFEAFDTDRDEKLNDKDWEVFRAMLASENGLLSIRMGGNGDQTSTAIRWRYQKPVPQVPSTLLYKGVLYMINDSGILLSFDPATGRRHQTGTPAWCDRQILLFPRCCRRQGFSDRCERSRIGLEGLRRVGGARGE